MTPSHHEVGPLHAGPGGGGYGPPGGGGYGPPGGGGYGPPGGGYGAPPPGGFGGGPPGMPPQGGGFGQPPGFGPPGGYGGGPPGFGGDPMLAESKIKAPAITMLVFCIIGMLVQLVNLAMNILGTGMQVANNNSEASQLMSGAVGIVMNIVGLLAGGFCVWAFLGMMKMKSRGLALTAVILSMIPCTGSCWCINLWVGIWALIVLNDPAVKGAFQSSAPQFQG